MNAQDMERHGTGPQRDGKEASHELSAHALRLDRHSEVAPRWFVIHQPACRSSHGRCVWAVFETEEEATRNLADKADCGGHGCHVAIEVVR